MMVWIIRSDSPLRVCAGDLSVLHLPLKKTLYKGVNMSKETVSLLLTDLYEKHH